MSGSGRLAEGEGEDEPSFKKGGEGKTPETGCDDCSGRRGMSSVPDNRAAGAGEDDGMVGNGNGRGKARSTSGSRNSKLRRS